MKKRILVFLLTLALVFSLFPVSAFAADVVAGGSCGPNVSWTLYSDGNLVLSGSGEYTSSPWRDLDRSLIRTLTVGQGITRILNNSFGYCMNLTGVSIPSSVVEIEYGAFNACSRIQSVSIAEGVKKIGNNAFDSDLLTSISLPASLEEIHPTAFDECTALKSILISPGNPNFCSYNGVLFDKSMSKLVIFPDGISGSYTVPAGVTTIGTYAFSNANKLTTLVLPDGVTDIEFYAIRYCKALTSLSLPSSLRNIDTHGIGYCDLLSRIDLNEGLVSLGINGIESLPLLSTVSIPASLVKLGDNCFSSCPKLTAINVSPANGYYTSVDGVVFDKDLLTLVRMPEGRTGSYTVPSTVTTLGISCFAKSALSSINLPEGLIKISSNSFYYCDNLTSLVIPSTVSTMDNLSLYPCKNLQTVVFLGDIPSPGYGDFSVETNCKDTVLYVPESSVSWTSAKNFDAAAQTFSGYPVIFGRPHVHEYVPTVTAPTCTAGGYTTYRCSCGESYVGNATAALGHDYVNKVCTRCGAVKPAVNPFTDVFEYQANGSKNPFYDSILWAVDEGITTGFTPTTFAPDATCTRGQVVTFLWRAAGKPQPASSVNPFTDVVSTSPYYTAILWAAEQGITGGYEDHTFRPGNSCTRAHVVTFLWRYEGKPLPVGSVSLVDLIGLNADFTAAIKWAASVKITTGYADGTFRPNAVCTRAHVVTFLDRSEHLAPVDPFSIGSYQANTYTSRYFGLSWALPSGWVFATPAEIAEMNGLVNESLDEKYRELIETSMITDMFAQKPETGANLIVQLIKIPAEERATLSEDNFFDGIDLSYLYQDAVDAYGATNVKASVNSVLIAGTAHPGVASSYDIYGTTVYQQLVVIIKGDYMMYIYVTSGNSQDISSVLSRFTAA